MDILENLEIIPVEETVSGSSVPAPEQTDETYNSLYHAFTDAFRDVLDNHFVTIEDNQVSLLEFLQDCCNYSEPSDEDKLKQEEQEQLDQQYREDLLDTLHDINAGVVSQNALLEENNRLLEQSVSMTLSENSVSQNSIMTTKLEDYSLTDSLLLILIVLVSFFCFITIFVRKGV